MTAQTLLTVFSAAQGSDEELLASLQKLSDRELLDVRNYLACLVDPNTSDCASHAIHEIMSRNGTADELHNMTSYYSYLRRQWANLEACTMNDDLTPDW